MDLASAIAAAIKPLFLTTRANADTVKVAVPSIGTGAAYANLDQFGGLIEFSNMAREKGGSFVISTARFYDLDYEKLNKVLHLFRAPVTLAADNAAYSVSDADSLQAIGYIQFSHYDDHVNNATFTEQPALYLQCAPGTTSIWGALSTTGADNIAAKSEPYVELLVVRD